MKLFGFLVISLAALSVSQFRVHSGAQPDRFFAQVRIFDEYGLTNWEDELARLDNFAIQLMHEPQLTGYIFVINGRVRTILQPAPREWGFSYPTFGSRTPPGKIHRIKKCSTAITRLKKNRL